MKKTMGKRETHERGLAPLEIARARSVRPSLMGFTLIELLVVISIISLLSSVVLAAMNGARVKADDTQRNQIVGEYVKALALAYDKTATGQYPTPASAITTPRCLGDYPTIGNHSTSAACRYGLSTSKYDEDSTVLDAVAFYLTSLPTLKAVTTDATHTYDGPFYYCNTLTDCSLPKIEWYLQQPNQKCIKGAGYSNIGSGTQCILTLK